MNLKDYQKKTKKLSLLFKRLPGDIGNWDAKTYMINLVEEIGELSNAMLVEEGKKSLKRKKSNVADSLCDSLYSLFMIAECYNLDLEEEYDKVLNDLEGRINNGEFS